MLGYARPRPGLPWLTGLRFVILLAPALPDALGHRITEVLPPQENVMHNPLGSNPPDGRVLYDFVRAHYELVGMSNAPERKEQFEIYRLNPQ
jgi:hypothetical protein